MTALTPGTSFISGLPEMRSERDISNIHSFSNLFIYNFFFFFGQMHCDVFGAQKKKENSGAPEMK